MSLNILKQKIVTNLLTRTRPPCLRTIIRSGSDSAAYDGDGKTTVRILNHDEPHVNLVNAYSNKGFRLANNLFVTGSILLFPTHVYSWSVNRGIDITLESLIIFDLIVPKTKIIVIGYGSQNEKYDSSLPMRLKQKGISCEMLPTPSAVTTYNFLVSDAVHVAGAFVPVKETVFETERDRIPYQDDFFLDGPYFGPAKSIGVQNEEDLEEAQIYREWERKNIDRNKKTFDP